MSLWADAIDLYRFGIVYSRILKGEKPADLPLANPTKFELVINLKDRKGARLDVPLHPPTARRRGDAGSSR